MKSLIVASIMAFSLSVNAASTTLITLKRNAGFSPRPQSSQLTISENGYVVRTITTTREATKETLAKLSMRSVESLKEKIATVDDNAELVDPNPNAPRCMDAPSSSVEVKKGEKVLTIQRWVSCHTSTVQSGEAEILVDLMEAFDSL